MTPIQKLIYGGLIAAGLLGSIRLAMKQAPMAGDRITVTGAPAPACPPVCDVKKK